MAETGTCKHGKFDLMDGCPRCIAECRASWVSMTGVIVGDPGDPVRLFLDEAPAIQESQE